MLKKKACIRLSGDDELATNNEWWQIHAKFGAIFLVCYRHVILDTNGTVRILAFFCRCCWSTTLIISDHGNYSISKCCLYFVLWSNIYHTIFTHSHLHILLVYVKLINKTFKDHEKRAKKTLRSKQIKFVERACMRHSKTKRWDKIGSRIITRYAFQLRMWTKISSWILVSVRALCLPTREIKTKQHFSF